MKIGLAGPLLVQPFLDILDKSSLSSDSIPHGQAYTPVNLLGQGLLDRGHELTLFTLDMEVSNEVILDGPNVRLCIGPYRSRPRDRALDLFRLERNYIKEAVTREQPNILHANWTYEYALGALASGVPTLVSVRDWAPMVLWHYQNIYRFIRYILNAMTLRRARHFVANSPHIQKLLLKKIKRKVPIIPNPVDDTFLRESDKPFPSGSPKIVVVNRNFTKLKNQKTLMRALPFIRREIPECELHLVGPDFEPDGVAERWAKANGLTEGIAYVGPLERDKLKDVLDQATLMVHPSLEESFGSVLVEAMARKVPVVGGIDSGAVPWVLDNGQAGILCDVKAPQSIAASVINVLRSPKKWQEMSSAGYRRVLQFFRLPKVVEAFENQYTQLLKAGS